MDPITLLAAASAVWNGIKKASEFAQEAEGVGVNLVNTQGLQISLSNTSRRLKTSLRNLSYSVI
jgi:hypothetical protein